MFTPQTMANPYRSDTYSRVASKHIIIIYICLR